MRAGANHPTVTLSLAATLNSALLTFHHHPAFFFKHKMIGFVSLLRTMYVDEPCQTCRMRRMAVTG
jgi:hypothetical protein